MKRDSVQDLQHKVLDLQSLLDNEIDEDKQLGLELDIKVLQSKIKRLKAKDNEIEK